MIAWALVGAVAAGQPCVQEPDRDTVAVAWVSPVRKRVRANTFVDVVPVVELREWLSEPSHARVGALLASLGLRRKASEPARPWKVTIFEVEPTLLCRPIESVEEGAWEAGVPLCPSARTALTTDGAGCVADAGLQAFKIRWRDAVRRGFCVLPADRFVAEGAP